MGGSLSANQGVESGLPYRGLWSGFHGRRPIPPTASPLWKLDKCLEMTEEMEMCMLRPRAPSDQCHAVEVCLSGQLEDTVRNNSS